MPVHPAHVPEAGLSPQSRLQQRADLLGPLVVVPLHHVAPRTTNATIWMLLYSCLIPVELLFQFLQTLVNQMVRNGLQKVIVLTGCIVVTLC